MRRLKYALLSGFLVATMMPAVAAQEVVPAAPVTGVRPPALAAPNFVGQMGLLVTPNTWTLAPGEFSVGYRSLDKDILGGGEDMDIIGGAYGFSPRLEAGFAYVNRDDEDLLVNAKYQLVRERAGLPSVTVGVVDLFDALDHDPGAYILLGKDLSALLGAGADGVAPPLHAYVGLGTGPYDGVIAGATLLVSPRLAFMAEYAPEGPLTGRDNSVNLGARIALTNNIRLTAGLFDFDSVGIGVSFTTGMPFGF